MVEGKEIRVMRVENGFVVLREREHGPFGSSLENAHVYESFQALTGALRKWEAKHVKDKAAEEKKVNK